MKPLETKLSQLKQILELHQNIGIAFSGGVDSTFLIAFATSACSNLNVTGITVNAPNFAPDEIEYTRDFCKERNIPHLVVDLKFSQIEGLKENSLERCYSCKKSIFTHVGKIAAANGIFVIADGTNLDDDADYRPGKRALAELGVISPLKEVGLTKLEIRQALKEMNIAIWNKPAFACLASRIPYGEEITEQKLHAVYMVEKAIRDAGFTQVRVRHHGQVARIEVLPQEMQSFVNPENLEIINQTALNAGFSFAALDLSGYRMGNMHQSIHHTTKL